MHKCCNRAIFFDIIHINLIKNEGDTLKLNRIIALLLATVITSASGVSASVLGPETIKSSRTEIAHGAVLESNVVYSSQSGVGYQSENFVEYTPNEQTVPILVRNDSLYTRYSVTDKASFFMEQNVYPAMMMNADFFSMDMGYPVSHQIADGKIIVQDSQNTDALGINKDGTAFIAPISVTTQMEIKATPVPLTVINMVRQDWGIFAFTSDFGLTTKSKGPAIHVVITIPEDITLNSTVTGVVEDVFESDDEVALSPGKLVVTADLNAEEYIINYMKLFEIGDEVKFTNTCQGDERWQDAKYILGAVGGRLLTDSQITIKDADAAPRTAVGIKEDGTVIFYTIDGRQYGHSYGVRTHTLAKRLRELGCTDAVNLDGGGSTAIGAIYPGTDNFALVNSPSGGSQRKVPSYIALINKTEKTGITEKLFVYPTSGNYLSGTKVQFTAYATDENYYKTPVPDNVTFKAGNSTKSNDGKITLKGDGEITITATSGEITGSTVVNCFESPTSIPIKNASTGKAVTSVDILTEESISLTATAVSGNKKLIADKNLFKWDCSEDIGFIDENGNFTASKKAASGEITVTAGKYTERIPVNVYKENEYTEIIFSETEDGTVKIEFNSNSKEELEKKNISIRTDGKETEFELSDNCIELEFDDDWTHKINVQVMNAEGFKSIASHTTTGKSHPNIFADVDDNYWAKDYITYMNYHNVVRGTIVSGKNYFNPASNITRAEFAVMVANILGINTKDFESESLGTADEDTIPDWCINQIKALCELGIMNGKEQGEEIVFDAFAELTRAEATKVISDLLPENLQTEEKSFKDEDEIPSWCKESFEKLAGIGILSGFNDGTVRPMNKITRAEVIRMLYTIY